MSELSQIATSPYSTSGETWPKTLLFSPASYHPAPDALALLTAPQDYLMAYPIMLEESIAKRIFQIKKIRTEWAQLLPWVNATPHPSKLLRGGEWGTNQGTQQFCEIRRELSCSTQHHDPDQCYTFSKAKFRTIFTSTKHNYNPDKRSPYQTPNLHIRALSGKTTPICYALKGWWQWFFTPSDDCKKTHWFKCFMLTNKKYIYVNYLDTKLRFIRNITKVTNMPGKNTQE